jgi:protein TonB
MGAMQASVQDRLVSALGTAIILTLFGYLLIVGMNVDMRRQADRAIALLDVRIPLPPPVHKPKPVQNPKTGRPSSRPSPRNLKNKATPLVAPPPLIPLPAPSPVVVALKPGAGMATSNGASNRAGPGEGSGGQGNGSGNGGDGDGDGGGDTPPRQIKGRLKDSDLPADLLQTGRLYVVSVRYTVDVTGHVQDCAIAHSSGSAGLDTMTCRLIQQRFRFDPSRDAARHPVESIIEEDHSWEIDPPSAPSRQ